MENTCIKKNTAQIFWSDDGLECSFWEEHIT